MAVGVVEGVAGTGVKVALRVAEGRGVLVGMTVTPAPSVGVGGSKTRPHPAIVRLSTTTNHSSATARLFPVQILQITALSAPPRTRPNDNGSDCNKSGR